MLLSTHWIRTNTRLEGHGYVFWLVDWVIWQCEDLVLVFILYHRKELLVRYLLLSLKANSYTRSKCAWCMLAFRSSNSFSVYSTSFKPTTSPTEFVEPIPFSKAFLNSYSYSSIESHFECSRLNERLSVTWPTRHFVSWYEWTSWSHVTISLTPSTTARQFLLYKLPSSSCWTEPSLSRSVVIALQSSSPRCAQVITGH